MSTQLFSIFGHSRIVEGIRKEGDYELGELIFRSFPDEETYVQIQSKVDNQKIIFVADLVRPDAKILPLIFAAETARDLGAKELGLVVPYLPYMRQDAQFNAGEGITSKYFAGLLSHYFNWLITIDPHLHRFHSLSEIYKIPSLVLHPTHLISEWIKHNTERPLLIGPDQESEQWVSNIAKDINAPFIILEKRRKGDRVVEIQVPDIQAYTNYTPVLLDDIISSARTMIEAIAQLHRAGLKAPVCVAVHAVFSGNAYQDLLKAGACKVVSCNSIPHVSNAIDLAPLIAKALSSIALT